MALANMTPEIMNIFHNSIPNKIINCSYKWLPWMTEDIKSRLKDLNHFLENRKIPAIPPLLECGDTTTNFSEKLTLTSFLQINVHPFIIIQSLLFQ